MSDLTLGQAAYVAEQMSRANDGEQTTVAVTGVRTSYEIIPNDEVDRPFLVRWTITADDGTMATLDEWPPLSSEEQEVVNAALEAESQRVQVERAAEMELLRQAEQAERDRQFHEAVAAEVERVLANRPTS